MEPVIPEVVEQIVDEIPAGPSCSMEEGCVACSA